MAVSVTTPNTVLSTVLPREGTARTIGAVLAVVAGSLLLWLASKIQVPFWPVPMTLTTLVVMLIGAAYGWKLGVATVLLFLAQGAIGLPVFSGTPERGIGLAYMLGPTGGYLIGYVVAVFIVGWFAERGADKSAVQLFFVMLPAGIVVLALGWIWLAVLIGPEPAWTSGVVPFLLGDILKIAIAALAVAGSRLAVPRQE